jgi:hypothetical protein
VNVLRNTEQQLLHAIRCYHALLGDSGTGRGDELDRAPAGVFAAGGQTAQVGVRDATPRRHSPTERRRTTTSLLALGWLLRGRSASILADDCCDSEQARSTAPTSTVEPEKNQICS